MSYLLYAVPLAAFAITACIIAVARSTTREEFDDEALRQDIERRYGSGEA